MVDATYIRVERPKRYALERRLYSTYKKYHAVFFMAIVDRRGQQQHCSAADAQACCPCSSCCLSACLWLAGRFRYVDIGNSPRGSSESAALYLARDVFLQPGLFLLGDVAYTADDRVRTGWRGPDLDPARVGAVVAAARRAYNQRLSSLRIRVEHAFSRLKHTWQLLQSTWKMPLERLAPTLRAAVLLSNYLAVSRNIYI